MKISIVDAQTGELIERDMTAEEEAELEAQNAAYAARIAEEEIKAQELKAAKISAYEKLGLTAEEIQALITELKPKDA